jgi:hypothetical protein
LGSGPVMPVVKSYLLPVTIISHNLFLCTGQQRARESGVPLVSAFIKMDLRREASPCNNFVDLGGYDSGGGRTGSTKLLLVESSAKSHLTLV